MQKITPVKGQLINGREKVKVQSVNTEESLTQKQFQKDTDINLIMKRYEAQGISYNGLPDQPGIYADLTVIPQDYAESLNQVMRAEEAFMSLPAELRAQYGNNPQNLVDWLSDPKNNDKAVELGLKKKKEAPPVQQQASAPVPSTEPPKTP